MSEPALTLSRREFDAAVFDLDGVVTRTARVHRAAWRETFDRYLAERGRREGREYESFSDGDYLTYVDGKPRYDGAESFLRSRGIELPRGDPEDPPERETVCGLGNRKNRIFREKIQKEGVEVFTPATALIQDLRAEGFGVAVVSSSRNCRAVLEAAGIEGLFDARVDGEVAAREGLQGKPAPDLFLEAARRLGADPSRTVVFEDAEAGVEAGRRGGFGCVVGVRRSGSPEGLLGRGADRVVPELSRIAVERSPVPMEELPSALEVVDELAGRERGGELAVFLDYDGTLTAIVRNPEDAVLPTETRGAVARLARRCTVAVVSGRDLADVREKVDLPDLVYAGSHGFDIQGPEGEKLRNRKGESFLPALDSAQEALEEDLDAIPGVRLERKKYSIAVHYREVPDPRAGEVEAVVDRVLSSHPRLRKGTGKKVFELQPALEWDKGRAVLWLLESLDLDRPGVLPVYVGDDVTDEDAFRALERRGVGIAVRDEPRPTRAHYALENPADVRRFLEALARSLENR